MLVLSEDQFYIPVKTRESQNQQRPRFQKAKIDVTEKSSSYAKSKTTISEKRNPKATSNLISKAPFEPSQFLLTLIGWVLGRD